MEYWSNGVLEYWSIGVLEYWSNGVLEYWSIGVLEYWSIGGLDHPMAEGHIHRSLAATPQDERPDSHPSLKGLFTLN